MTFKWNITLPPFQGMANGVEVTRAGIALEFETGSIGEAHGIFSDNGTALSETFGNLLIGRASDLATNIGGAGPQATATETIADTEERKKRGRGPNKPKVTATAPEPLAIPGADAPSIAPIATAPVDGGIPEALRRDPTTNTSAVVPAPPPPPPPPAPPAAPPTGILAGKIAAELDKRATGAPDGGQALADWLATSGITVKGATFAEAVTVLRLQADEKLGPIATALGVV